MWQEVFGNQLSRLILCWGKKESMLNGDLIYHASQNFLSNYFQVNSALLLAMAGTRLGLTFKILIDHCHHSCCNLKLWWLVVDNSRDTSCRLKSREVCCATIIKQTRGKEGPCRQKKATTSGQSSLWYLLSPPQGSVLVLSFCSSFPTHPEPDPWGMEECPRHQPCHQGSRDRPAKT